MDRQEELRKKYDEREKWFQDRIGKRVYRTRTTCKCSVCTGVYEHGIIIGDEMHASYIHTCEGDLNLKYFDTLEERTEYEKKHPRPRKRVSAKK